MTPLLLRQIVSLRPCNVEAVIENLVSPFLRAHTHTHVSISTDNSSCLFIFPAQIFPKLPTFPSFSIPAFFPTEFLINLHVVSKTADFQQSNLVWFTAQREEKRSEWKQRAHTERISIFPLQPRPSESFFFF